MTKYLINPPMADPTVFPKECPEATYLDKQEFFKWLIENGYPEENIQRYFNHLLFVEFPKVAE